MNPNACLCPNTMEVAAKIIDGEAILINLSNGMYYSMDLVGGFVWELIEAGHNLGEIAEVVSAHYDVDLPQAESDVRRLAKELLEASLVLIGSPKAADKRNDDRKPPVERLMYEPPELKAYHDMAELLALDPPHPLLTDTLSKYPPKR